MDAESMGRLAEITAKEPAALTEDDVAFLRARRNYLSAEHRSVFASVLGEEAPADTSSDEPASDDEKGAKKGKK